MSGPLREEAQNGRDRACIPLMRVARMVKKKAPRATSTIEAVRGASNKRQYEVFIAGEALDTG
jgi:hypothetical protein